MDKLNIRRMKAEELCIPQHIAMFRIENGDGVLVDTRNGEWAQIDSSGWEIVEALKSGKSREEIERLFGERSAILDQLLEEEFLQSGRSSPFTYLTVPSLLSLHIELTNRCNLRCKHCYLSSGQEKANELTKEEVINLVDEVAMMGGEKISLSGGEPFMVKWLLDICRYAVERDFSVYVFTNGTFFDDNTVRVLKSLKRVVTQISIEGANPKMHDWIRGEGNFATIEQGIDRLCNAGLSENILLFGTLNRENIGTINEIVKFALSRNIRRIRFTQINKQGRANRDWEMLKPTYRQWIEYGKAVERIAKKYPDIEIIGNVYGGLKFEPGEFPRMTCECGKEPRIDCQGNVFPCQMFVSPQYIIGNIRQSSLSGTLNNGRLIDLKRAISGRIEANEKCRSCKFSLLCNAGCPGHSESEFGSINREDSLCGSRKFWFKEFVGRYMLDS